MTEDQFPTTPCRSASDTEPAPAVLLAEAVVMQFAGGTVSIPKPTKHDLILSAQQWAKAVREHIVDWNALTAGAEGKLNRLDAVLAELAKL